MATTKSRPWSWASWLVIAICSSVVFVSCQGFNKPQPQPEPQWPPSSAAELIEQVHATTPEADPVLYFQIAEALFREGAPQQAVEYAERVIASPVAAAQLDGSQRFELSRILISWYTGADPEQALTWAQKARPGTAAEHSQHQLMLSTIYLRLGQPELAVTFLHRSFLETLGPRQSDRLWSLINQVPAFRQRELAVEETDSVLRAWWNLAAAVNAAFSARTQVGAFAEWRKRYPEHPASRQPPWTLRQAPDDIRRVALILPLSGPLGNAAVAIQSGFMFGYLKTLQSFPDGIVQEVRVYDSGSRSLASAVELAFQDGAEIIAGPLTKAEVTQLLALELKIPVLALNRVDAPVRKRVSSNHAVLQLAIAIEDDAEAIAQEIGRRGHRRIVVLQGSRGWSQRATSALSAALPPSAMVTATGAIGKIEEITQVVGAAMGVEASHARFKDVQRAVGGKVEFQPRTRQDIDAIVALIDVSEIDSVLAALRFHFADGIPLYVPSPAVRGWNPSEYAEGIRMTNLPMLLAPSPTISELVEAFQPDGNALPFYALGIDAYRLVNQWSRLKSGEPVQGSVGTLHVTPQGTLRRVPLWGTITNRAARPDR